MGAARVYRTEGIVLKAYDYGEADRILTLITPHNGKLRAVAKGVRKTKSRMAGHLDLFMRSTVFVARGRQLDIVTQAQTIDNFRAVREDLWRSTYCHYVAELLDGFSAEALSNYPLYALSVQTYQRLATVANCDLVVHSFELQLLGHTGYRPQLHRCLGCEGVIGPNGNRFSARVGGVLCPMCAPVDASAPIISPAALKASAQPAGQRSGDVALAGTGKRGPARSWSTAQRVHRVSSRIIVRARSLFSID